jgi:hypothetical protein
MSIADPNKTILTGENPFIRLSLKDDWTSVQLVCSIGIK